MLNSVKSLECRERKNKEVVTFAALNNLTTSYRNNAKQILKTKCNEILNMKAENNSMKILEGLNYQVKQFQYFGLASNVKLLDFLINKSKDLG